MGPGCPDVGEAEEVSEWAPITPGCGVIIIRCQDVQSPIIIEARRSLSSGKLLGMNKQYCAGKKGDALVNSLKSLRHGP